MKKIKEIIIIKNRSDILLARQIVKQLGVAIGFDTLTSENIELVINELATNLIKHANKGELIISSLNNGKKQGVQIESVDSGPGFNNIEKSITNGYSTKKSLGYGLGIVNRIMDELEISSKPGYTHIICKYYIKNKRISGSCPFLIDGASRPRLGMSLNGDSFIIKRWNHSALVGVIDGLGHGQFAHRAAKTAWNYIMKHYDQPLDQIFRGTGRTCSATRGVVMALARFDWTKQKITLASIGNITVRVIGSSEKIDFIIRRGILGIKSPNPVINEKHWDPSYIMILHSDGIISHWNWDNFYYLQNESATKIAQVLLRSLAKDDDDATVVVVRGKI